MTRSSGGPLSQRIGSAWWAIVSSLAELRPLRSTPRQARVLLVVALASVAVSLAVERAANVFLQVDAGSIQNRLVGLGPWAPFVYVVIVVVAIVAAPVPSVPLDIAAGLTFGVVWGSVLTLIGDEIGALVAFALARRFGRRWLRARFGGARFARIDHAASVIGPRSLFVARLLPVFSFEWVSYGAGLTRMSVRSFAVATFAGMLLPVTLLVAMGDALATHPERAAAIFALLLLVAFAPLAGYAFARGGRPSA